jgi:hypothetical protein
MTVIIDGTAGITFPVTAATGSAVQASSGRVLQVVSSSLSSGVSTSSASYVTTGLTASITPSSSSSKVLVIANSGRFDSDTAGNSIIIALYKNGSEIISPGSAGFVALAFSISNSSGNSSLNYLDAPATTSSTTYALFIKRAGSGLVFFNNSGVANITLMEIAA